MKSRSGMKKLDSILPDALGRDEVLRMARAHQALRCWPEVVGAMLADRSRPDRYDHGTVWVAVQGSAWAQELRMMKPLILNRLRSISDEADLFVDVRFGVRPFRDHLLPIPEPEAPPARPVVDPELTIREIAEKRIATWSDEKGTRA